MSDTAGEFLASLAGQPWRPKSLHWPKRERLPWRTRAALLCLIVAVHCLVAIGLLAMMHRREAPSVETVTVIEFIEDRPVAVAPSMQPVAPPLAPRIEPRRLPIDGQEVELPIVPSSIQKPRVERQATRPNDRLELYGADGRLRTPDDMLDTLDREFGDKRVFSYQIPRLDDAQKLLNRNPAIEYRPTRFDQYWKPDEDLLTDLLTRLVEKTTREIRIPVPGRPDSAMICTVSLLALGGGCGMLTNGADYVGPVDDPDTLDGEEQRQCQAWWDQITGARTQEVWRRTRALYESECRKPRLRER